MYGFLAEVGTVDLRVAAFALGTGEVAGVEEFIVLLVGSDMLVIAHR